MKKIYIWTIIISIAFIIPGCIVSYPVLNVLTSIGYSGIAAAIMAIVIEKHTKDQQEAIKKKAKKAYFQELHGQLKILLKRIVWFDDRMNDARFDWEKNPKEYLSLNYMLWALNTYPEYKLSYDEINDRVLKIAEKYSLEQQEKMNSVERNKVYKMFNILGVSGAEILKQIRTIDENKLMLDIVNYMQLDESKGLCSITEIIINLMMSTGKNYGDFVLRLFETYKMTCNICGRDETFDIDVFGSVYLNELR